MLVACGRINFVPGGDDGQGGDGGTRGDGGGDSDGEINVGANVIFVTARDIVPGALGGIENADARCRADAAAAGLPGEYVAWMSTTTQTAISRVAGSRGWVRPDGMPFADTTAMLMTSRVWTPPSVMADGTDLVFDIARHVITGASASGGVSDYDTCSDWTSTSTMQLPGKLTSSLRWATNPVFDMLGCGATARIYCIGIGADVPVVTPQVAGRRAFLSSFQPSGNGTQAFDTTCENEAQTQGLGGTWRALVADSTNPAAARFDGTGLPWVRLDGIPLAPTAQDLLTTGFRVPLDQLVDGTRASDFVSATWLGAPGLTAAATLACSDWMSASPSADGAVGNFYMAGTEATTSTMVGCQGTARLYCLEL